MKPILDADGMAEHLKTVSQSDWPQLLDLWRMQQYAAGHRDAEDARKRNLEEQHQFAAGRAEGKREAEEARPAPAEYPYPVLTQLIVELDQLRDMGAEL